MIVNQTFSEGEKDGGGWKAKAKPGKLPSKHKECLEIVSANERAIVYDMQTRKLASKTNVWRNKVYLVDEAYSII